ncbi:MAG: hypothetical protein FWE37_01135 [Spirochaetaceae bacterium]|nr:hypothetical protein [Spirochaetaceae bacterium]
MCKYWVVRNPYWVYCYLLNDEGRYTESIYRDQTDIKMQIFEDLNINFSYLQKF